VRFLFHSFLSPEQQVINKHRLAFISSEITRRHNSHEHNIDHEQREQAITTKCSSAISHSACVPARRTSTVSVSAIRDIVEIDLAELARTTNLSSAESITDQAYQDRCHKQSRCCYRQVLQRQSGTQKKNMEISHQRDKLVEQILDENKDLRYVINYSHEPEMGSVCANAKRNANANNDDDFAERFRQQYYDARRQKRNKRPQTDSRKRAVKQASRGPWLGGSRNSRRKKL
jgi:hypothetical protein